MSPSPSRTCGQLRFSPASTRTPREHANSVPLARLPVGNREEEARTYADQRGRQGWPAPLPHRDPCRGEVIVMRRGVDLESEVAAIGDLNRVELVARWTKIYGRAPPPGVRRELLRHAAAWHLQARQLGGFSADILRKLNAAMADVSARAARKNDKANQRDGSGVLSPSMQTAPSSTHVARAVPPVGARLIREWNGRTHVVDVVEGGFVFDGKTYRSLTAIAKRITGAHWSGPRFFGL